MQGIERNYCNVCIKALISAWMRLMEVPCAETLRPVKYGKGDTLGLDAIPEITISNRIREFDNHAIFITEELDDRAHRHWPTDSNPESQPLMFFCDPTDRSSQLKKFFERISKKDPIARAGDIMKDCDSEKIWEEMFESPVSITGATSAITCVRKGEIVFSIILNFINATICIAVDTGIYWYKLESFSSKENKNIALDDIFKRSKQLAFPGMKGCSSEDYERFVTFLGKKGYKENFDDSGLFVKGAKGSLHHSLPPGPPRPLYLSDLQDKPIGFILANGEKISEWMHWLSFVKYAKNADGNNALRAYEIVLERPWTKQGVLMSPSIPYSLFCDIDGRSYIDISRLRTFKRPSQFRSMIVVAPYDNERIIHVLEQHQYREITHYF